MYERQVPSLYFYIFSLVADTTLYTLCHCSDSCTPLETAL